MKTVGEDAKVSRAAPFLEDIREVEEEAREKRGWGWQEEEGETKYERPPESTRPYKAIMEAAMEGESFASGAPPTTTVVIVN